MRGLIFTENKIRNELNKISTYEDIKKIDAENDHILYNWVPALVFNVIGYDAYKKCDLNKEDSNTFLMFRPGEIVDDTIIKDIKQIGDYTFTKCRYKFTKKLISILYGGFPWFPAYCCACEKESLWDEIGEVLFIRDINYHACIKKIIDVKNRYRDNNINETINIKLTDKQGFGFDGIIHSFHSPNPIENNRHCQAINEELLEGI